MLSPVVPILRSAKKKKNNFDRKTICLSKYIVHITQEYPSLCHWKNLLISCKYSLPFCRASQIRCFVVAGATCNECQPHGCQRSRYGVLHDEQ